MKLEIVCNAADFVKEIALAEKECFSEPWSEGAIKDFFEYGYNSALVCLADGEFAGYVTYTEICGEIQIANVATVVKFRRCGVGLSLILRLVEMAKENKCQVITLEVREQNIPATALYERCGFTKVGVRKNFYKKPDDNAVLMNLELGN